MDIRVDWLPPSDLVNGDKDGLIYNIRDLEDLPETPGVYVFSRVHGRKVSPLYIGKARNLRRRLRQQLHGNVKLLRGIEDAPMGYRTAHIGEVAVRPAKNIEKALAVVESALITAALVAGFELLNVMGTRTLVHTITSSGDRESRRWLPENVIKVRRVHHV